MTSIVSAAGPSLHIRILHARISAGEGSYVGVDGVEWLNVDSEWRSHTTTTIAAHGSAIRDSRA